MSDASGFGVSPSASVRAILEVIDPCEADAALWFMIACVGGEVMPKSVRMPNCVPPLSNIHITCWNELRAANP